MDPYRVREAAVDTPLLRRKHPNLHTGGYSAVSQALFEVGTVRLTTNSKVINGISVFGNQHHWFNRSFCRPLST